MPEFYILPKKLARRAPALSAAAHHLEAALLRSIFWLLRRLSLERAMQLAGGIFALFGPHTDKARKARNNLAIAFPNKPEQWYADTTRNIFRHLGYSAVELIRLQQIWDEREQRLEFVLMPGAKEHLESKKATIFMTAHVGPWQVAPLILREFGIDINGIYAPESNPIMQGVMLDLRRAISDKWIATEAGPRPIIRALNDGQSVIMAMDTRPDTGKLLPFFGRDALTNTSAVGLAIRTGAALLVARGERLPGARYRITMYDPLVSPEPDAPVKDQAVALTRIIHRHFESWITEYPEQWICLKRRWPKSHKL